MKATGEVMAICDNFEGALMKAIRSLEQHVDSLLSYDFTALSREELLRQLEVVDDRRIWVIAEAVRRGISYEEIHAITKIDLWFKAHRVSGQRDCPPDRKDGGGDPGAAL